MLQYYKYLQEQGEYLCQYSGKKPKKVNGIVCFMSGKIASTYQKASNPKSYI